MGMRTIRPIRVVGNDAFVPLTLGLEAIIDASDAAAIGQFNWSARKRNATAYAFSWDGQKSIRLHRVLLGDACVGFDVDHINGNGLDNRRANLRVATRSENMRNRGAQSNSRTGVKGVHIDRRSGRFRAVIGLNGHLISLGFFGSVEAAAAAYAEAAARLHGAFARTG